MAETTEQPTHKVRDDGTVLVPLKLAHPMQEEYAKRARVEEVRDYKVGETVWVTRESGNALIEAGRVQVDPVNRKLRQEVLFLNRRNQPLTAKEIAKKLGVEAEPATGEGGDDGDVDAAVPAKTNAAPTKARTAGAKA